MANRKKKSPRVERTRNAGTSTEAEYFGKIRSALRRAFMYWKPMTLALEAASRPSQNKNKLVKKEYQCAECLSWKPRNGVHMEHKIPCGSLRTYEDIVPFIIRLTSENVEDYQVLCKTCHIKKSTEEKRQRKIENL